eukprot:TRINITY_DN19647_c0_g1_i1.p1 TRINITY_DN19647_c0_g1~~TRINITY_DN19647_c0_g1_i1.p1  ORF type:complete len:242 (+),score=18.09 TRINITY_DN19647_c0_g1_i1:70-795(+)
MSALAKLWMSRLSPAARFAFYVAATHVILGTSTRVENGESDHGLDYSEAVSTQISMAEADYYGAVSTQVSTETSTETGYSTVTSESTVSNEQTTSGEYGSVVIRGPKAKPKPKMCASFNCPNGQRDKYSFPIVCRPGGCDAQLCCRTSKETCASFLCTEYSPNGGGARAWKPGAIASRFICNRGGCAKNLCCKGPKPAVQLTCANFQCPTIGQWPRNPSAIVCPPQGCDTELCCPAGRRPR